ncbi:MAG: hypothetical protein C0424_05500 [Sphingobacteriaceae bacterium]|nr:hypothetical protein [Sphingobacteriaceae bacterium]
MWLSTDPLADKYPHVTPYSYCLSNPVNFRDPFGLEPWPIWQRIRDWFKGTPQNDPNQISIEQARAGQGNPGQFFIDINDRRFEMSSDKEWIQKATVEVQSGGRFPGWVSDVITGLGAFGLGNGAKTELLDYAVRSNFKSAQTWGQFNKLRSTQQAWRTVNTLGKTGATYLKYAKGLGVVGAGVSTAYSIANAGMYYYNGGSDWQVGAKSTLDVIMTGAAFLGPIGFGISATYFILDASTGGFRGFGSTKP